MALVKRDLDGTVMQGGRKIADAGQGGRGKRVVFMEADLRLCNGRRVGTAFVAGIEDAAELFFLGELGVQFIEEQRGLAAVRRGEK